MIESGYANKKIKQLGDTMIIRCLKDKFKKNLKQKNMIFHYYMLIRLFQFKYLNLY